MQFFHTSPNKIESITSYGRFDEFLFFSCKIYVMSVGPVITYSLELDESTVIGAGSLFYHEDAGKLSGLVGDFCRRFGVDEEAAEEIISERRQLDSCDPDEAWDAQLFTARAAKLLGFRAVRVTDEQGSAYMVDMLGRESELVLE